MSLAELHTAIIGGTGSGKTFLAQQWAASFMDAGRGVLALHKPREPWPRASWQTDDPERYKAMFWRAKRCACFMELADAEVNKNDAEYHKFFSMGRHEGHRCFYISQYGPQVHPIIRMNCTGLALFATNRRAAATWAEEFNDETLMRACSLPPRWFYLKRSRYEPAALMTLEV